MTASLGRTGLTSATLLVLSGPVRGSRIEVPAGGLLFGRAADSAGRLGDDLALSRWHARLDLAGDGLVVEDLASSNGTLLNGQRISGRQPVRPGDVVTIGTSQLQLQALPTAATAPAQLRTLATTVLPALAAAPPAPPPVPAPAGRAAPAQPGSPPGSWGLVELPGVQPSFVAVAGRHLGRVMRGYLVLAVLLGMLAALLQVVRSRFGAVLPAPVMPGQWAKPAAMLLALSAGGLAVVAYLRTASTRMSLQAGRLDVDRGLLRREATAIDLRQLRRVTLDQTALQRLTGDGTLLLELADGAGPIPVTGLARGQQLQQVYRQLAALTPASRR